MTSSAGSLRSLSHCQGSAMYTLRHEEASGNKYGHIDNVALQTLDKLTQKASIFAKTDFFMSTQQDFSLIKQTVDKYFDFMDEIGGNSYMIDFIPKVMIDPNKKHEDDEYAYWVPLASTVSEQDINDLEKLFGHPLPGSYKFFLYQRHFIELYLGGYCINFFSNFPGELTPKFKEIIDEQYWNALERNYLPIAHFQDYGVLCLDANVKRAGNDYPVVMLDHEDGYEDREFYADSFLDMFDEFNSHLDEWIRNNRENRKSTSILRD